MEYLNQNEYPDENYLAFYNPISKDQQYFENLIEKYN